MDLNDNPFYLLKAKTTDDKRKLLKLAEESLINNESSKINSARLTLSNPKKRIFAECSWFLGEDNKNVDRILDSINHKNKVDFNLTNLSAANFFAYSILNSDINEESLFFIKKLITYFDFIDSKKVLEAINNDRNVSNIKLLNDSKDLNEDLNNLRRFYISTINKFFDQLNIADYSNFFSNIIFDLYSDGKDEYTLLSELVDSYELNTKQHIDKKEVEISSQIDAIEKYILPKFYKGNISLGLMTDKLITSIRDWIRILKPIQINFEKRGLVHSQSRNLAIVVRTLVGNLSNLDIDLALEILVELKQLFTEVSEIKDLISQDIKALTFAGAKIKVKKNKIKDTKIKSKPKSKYKSKTQSKSFEEKYKNFSEVRKNNEKKKEKININTIFKDFKFFLKTNKFVGAKIFFFLIFCSLLLYFYDKNYDNLNQKFVENLEIQEGDNKSDFLLRGNKMYRAKNYKSAIANYKKALTLDPNYFQAIFYLGLTFLMMEEYDESIFYFRKITSGNYESFEKRDAYQFLGDSLFQQKNYQLAIEAYSNAIKLERSFSKAYLGRGIVFNKLQDYDSAQKDFLEAINLGMRNSLIYQLLGDVNFNTKNYQQGITYYELAIKYSEKDEYAATAHYWRGYSFLKMNSIDDACADFKIAYKLGGKIYEKTYKKYCNP